MNRFFIFWIGLLFFAKVQAMPNPIERIRVGDTLPKFEVIIQNGDTVCSSDMSSSPCVLVFFHTRCYDCRRELPEVQQLYNVYSKEIRFLCISRAENNADISRFWEQEQLSLPYSAQSDKHIFKLFAERTIPRIYITDGRGYVTHIFKEKVRKRKLNAVLRKIVSTKEIIKSK